MPDENETIDHATHGEGALASLALPPGYAHQVTVFGFFAMVGMESLVALTSRKGWDLLPLLVPIVLLYFAMYHSRKSRQIRLDSSGFIFQRGDTVVVRLPWEEVATVRYMKKQSAKWVYVPTVTGRLVIQGKTRRARISIEDALYDLPPGSLDSFVRVIALAARERSIPVVDTSGPSKNSQS